MARVALITGASSGTGLATTRAFLAAGIAVVGVARDADRLARAALAAFGPEARIVNVSSTFALVGGLRGLAYSAANAGLNALTLHLAAQYRAQGVRADAVAPGVVPTPMTEHRLQDDAFRRMNAEMTPSPRPGLPRMWRRPSCSCRNRYRTASTARSWRSMAAGRARDTRPRRR
jgi:NAD(P)-dependent dehydrogenase (short-subunit alcohol dehydrogenase family)